MIATEIQAAQTILEEGVRFELPAPFFLRLFRKKTITLVLSDPTADMCLRITKKRLAMGVTDEEFENMTVEAALRFRQENGIKAAEIVAMAILKDRKRNRLFGRWLAKRLLKNYPFSYLLDIMHLLSLGGLADFMNTIILLRTMRLTAPNKVSQKDQKS